MSGESAGDQRANRPVLGAGSLSFDRVASIYDSTRGYPPAAAAAIAEGMMAHGALAAGASALEIGAGTGRIALPLLERGVNITGADIATRMTERFQAKYDAGRAAQPGLPWGALSLTLADVARLPYPDASFDAVIAVHVLHLIPGWRAALGEALRVLRRGAPLLLGQDMAHGARIGHPMQDEWLEIVRGLGYEAKRVGAASFADILTEARALGLSVAEWTVAEWTAPHTAAAAFADIAEKSWSLTWQVPEPIFSESVRLLEEWARATFGGRWNELEQVDFSFRLARVSHPDGR